MDTTKPNRLVIAAIIAAGAAMIFISTYRYGLGISNDGVIMLSAGENFAEGSGLLRFDDKPLIHWLPLLPVLVGGLYKITGIDTLIIALGINFIA
ncbi:MAG: hypothetical protein OEV06_12655, partial [Anaerolineae bacterium]|nr:hypothetical protein [Anaerolineae bacterium]